MKAWVFTLCVMLGVVFSRPTEANPYSALEFSRQVSLATWKSLQECGLQKMDAYSPLLPYPQVPAQLAVVNSKGVVLAYYYESPWGFVFKSPNGGNTHTVWVGDGEIKVITPYLGTVAWVNRWKTIEGYGFTYYCRSEQVTYPMFESCINQYYVQTIAAQLCRFP